MFSDDTQTQWLPGAVLAIYDPMNTAKKLLQQKQHPFCMKARSDHSCMARKRWTNRRLMGNFGKKMPVDGGSTTF